MKLLACIVIVFIYLGVNLAIEVEKELTLTHKEKVALDQFKLQVMDMLKEDYMKSDLYLLRWLRAQDLDLRRAREMLETNLIWRKENAIDGILDEDWSDFEERYFFDNSGTDFSSRPVVAADISEWDVRQAVVSGQGNKLVRYMIRSVESASQRVRKLQEKGENVTQWQVLLNLDNFNMLQHGCLQCLPIYLQFITAHESYYPFGADKIIAFNTPRAFEIVLELVKPLMSESMKDSLVVFGHNRNEWKKFITDLIPEDQLPPHFGGTKKLLL